MVEEINPTYYARTSEEPTNFEVLGLGFDEIPNDAVGLIGVSNDEPLRYKDVEGTRYLMAIVEKSDTRMLLQTEPHVFSNIFLGAIISADRTMVYWVNTTRPLP